MSGLLPASVDRRLALVDLPMYVTASLVALATLVRSVSLCLGAAAHPVASE